MLSGSAFDHAWIARHIPHQGAMCLLDHVERWDDKQVRCRASSHRAPDNPLRAHGRLGAACGIEYAAQAMAVHGALTTQDAPDTGRARVGYLVSVRGARLLAARLDDIDGDLEIVATSAMRAGDNVMYEFEVSAGGRTLLAGRAAVILNAAGLS